MSDEKVQAEIKGTFLGKPIDLTVRECAVPEQEDQEDQPSETLTEEPKAEEQPKVEGDGDGEAPKNPAGNAEQL